MQTIQAQYRLGAFLKLFFNRAHQTCFWIVPSCYLINGIELVIFSGDLYSHNLTFQPTLYLCNLIVQYNCMALPFFLNMAKFVLLFVKKCHINRTSFIIIGFYCGFYLSYIFLLFLSWYITAIKYLSAFPSIYFDVQGKKAIALPPSCSMKSELSTVY